MACRDCVWWTPSKPHRRYAPCMWPGAKNIPLSVILIEKREMREDRGDDCPQFKEKSDGD